MKGAKWTDEEKALLGGNMTVAELLPLLPHRTPRTIATARSAFFPYRTPAVAARLVEVRVKLESWCAEDIELLKSDKTATELQPLLSKQRSVWAIASRRRLLGIELGKGRPRITLKDLPGVDWSLPILRICKETGHSWSTLSKLQPGIWRRKRASGRPQLTLDDLSGVDWSLPNRAIAKTYRKSYRTVTKLRRMALGT